MKISIVYYSNTGNTYTLADAMRKELKDQEIVYFGEPPHRPIDADLYVIGSCIDNGNCVPEIAEYIKKLENKKIAYFATAGFGESKEYFDTLYERTKEIIPKTCTKMSHYYCPGKMPLSVRDEYIEKLKNNPNDTKMSLLVKNFDKVADRPNKDDIAGVQLWIRKVIQDINTFKYQLQR